MLSHMLLLKLSAGLDLTHMSSGPGALQQSCQNLPDLSSGDKLEQVLPNSENGDLEGCECC